nr:hypothetical protein [Escherichia coli]
MRCCIRRRGRAETGGEKELADGSVTRSRYDAAGRLTAQTDAAGRRTEYGLNVVSGDITDITTPDGRETKFYYNDGNQLTAVVSPDGLESRREYDEPGRLVSETSRSGRQYATATMTRTVSYRRRQRMRRAAPGR